VITRYETREIEREEDGATRAQNAGDERVFPLIVIGGLVTIIPLVLLFLLIQRRWGTGLLVGAVVE
jgi:hypothetical protein